MLEQLRHIVSDKGLITSAQEMRPFLTDWRGRWQGEALCVVSPTSVDEVAAVVKLAAAHNCPVYSQGGNTGLCYGAVPEPQMQGIVLSLRRMNRIRSVDVAANQISVDAGVILSTVHDQAAHHNRCFPLHLGSEGSAQIGGLISTNAGGTTVVRYGPMRDLVAGLEVVLADGRILRDMAGLRKCCRRIKTCLAELCPFRVRDDVADVALLSCLSFAQVVTICCVRMHGR